MEFYGKSFVILKGIVVFVAAKMFLELEIDLGKINWEVEYSSI